MPRRNQVNFCDCGGLKPYRSAACKSCQFLDGSRDTEGEIIAALRTTTPLSTTELTEIVGSERSNMWHVIKRLIGKGRVRRVEIEPEMIEQAGFGRRRDNSHFYELVSP